MKSLFQFSLASLFFFSLVLVSCNKESFDITEPIDLPAVIDTIFIDDPIALTVPGNESASILVGTAFWGENGPNKLFTFASDNVEVECPGGMATSYNGSDPDDEFFQIQFFEGSDTTFVLFAFVRTEIDGVTRTVSSLMPPETCPRVPVLIEYEVENDRITAELTGEFFYPNPVYTPPFENCDNYISTGIIEVSIDLPLVKCFER